MRDLLELCDFNSGGREQAVEWCKWRTTMPSIERCTELPGLAVMKRICWFWNVACWMGADFSGMLLVWREQPDVVHRLCCSSVWYLPVQSLDGDTRHAWNVPKQSAWTRWLAYNRATQQDQSVWLLLFMIQDAFDLGSAEPSITFLNHFLSQKHSMRVPCCRGHSLNETWVFMLLMATAVLRSSDQTSSLRAVKIIFEVIFKVSFVVFAIVKGWKKRF